MSTVATGAQHEFAHLYGDRDLRGGFVVLEGTSWRRRVEWRDHSYLGSAAFWVEETRRQPSPHSLRIGQSLIEEVALCLLGGYGINETMATTAFQAVRDVGLLDPSGAPTRIEIESVLRTPRKVGHARPVRYRFPAQRAARIAAAVGRLSAAPEVLDLTPRELRAFLTTLDGVGMKTASWVVRNLRRSDDIAVIDIHIRRAGGPYPRILDTVVDYAAVGSVTARRAS